MKGTAIPKPLLAEAIALTREYYLTGSSLTLSNLNDKTRMIERSTGIWWNNLENLLSSILSYRGIKPEATFDDICSILRQLGWEVSD